MARALTAGLLLPVEGERVSLRATDSEEIAVWDGRAGAAVGRVVLERDSDGDLVVRELCIDGTRRGYGAGSEAAALLERAARAAGHSRIRAIAPPDVGLAVYFWIRMGYRPLFGAGPGGGIWLLRELPEIA